MKINRNTKISELIDYNIKSIDAIATINKKFKKLKNPVLRKILAKRVSISEASKIGGSTVDKFFEVLSPLGFTIETDIKGTVPTKENNNNKEIKNNKIKISEMNIQDLDPKKITELDVRDEIVAGNDPFVLIMDELKKMPEGNTLKLTNIFEPIPLINKLNKKGYKTYADHSQDGVVITYFKKEEDMDIDVETKHANKDTFEKVKGFYGDKIKEIDVRGLEMPEPMVKTLSNAESLEEGWALYVNHKKVPQYLMPELDERGFKYLIYEIEEGDVKLLIFK